METVSFCLPVGGRRIKDSKPLGEHLRAIDEGLGQNSLENEGYLAQPDQATNQEIPLSWHGRSVVVKESTFTRAGEPAPKPADDELEESSPLRDVARRCDEGGKISSSQKAIPRNYSRP